MSGPNSLKLHPHSVKSTFHCHSVQPANRQMKHLHCSRLHRPDRQSLRHRRSRRLRCGLHPWRQTRWTCQARPRLKYLNAPRQMYRIRFLSVSGIHSIHRVAEWYATSRADRLVFCVGMPGVQYPKQSGPVEY